MDEVLVSLRDVWECDGGLGHVGGQDHSGRMRVGLRETTTHAAAQQGLAHVNKAGRPPSMLRSARCHAGVWYLEHLDLLLEGHHGVADQHLETTPTHGTAPSLLHEAVRTHHQALIKRHTTTDTPTSTPPPHDDATCPPPHHHRHDHQVMISNGSTAVMMVVQVFESCSPRRC